MRCGWLLLGLLACRAEAGNAPAPQPSAAVVHVRLAAKDAARVSAFDPLVAGLGQRIWNGPGDAELALDLDDTVRVTLGPESELWWLEPTQSLVLVAGRARVSRPPEAPRAGREPARLATLAGSATFASAVELELRSGPQARTQLTLARGAVLWSWLLPEQARPGSKRALVAVGGPVVEDLPVALSYRSEDAERLWPTLAERAAAPAEPQLQRALAALAQLRARSRELLAADAGVVRTYQRALASLARERLAATETLRLAAEQSFLSARCGCATARPCAPLERWAAAYTQHIRAGLGRD